MMSRMGYQRGELKAWNEVVWTVVLTEAFHGHLCEDNEDHVFEDSDVIEDSNDGDNNQVVWTLVLTEPFRGHLCDDKKNVIEDSDDSDDNQVWAVVLT